MKRNSEDEENGATRLELKYCEHCGGLWVRECGAGVVYCDNCRPKVADLPLGKKKPHRVLLPVRGSALVEDYAVEFRDGEGDGDLEAAGGVA